METRPTRLMLLGIAILLFALAFPVPLHVVMPIPLRFDRIAADITDAVLPVLGLALVLAGFFAKARA